MIFPIVSVMLLGLFLGLILGYASKVFAVQGDPLVEELIEMMPGTNCGQCSFPGCSGAANAIVKGEAAPDCCPGGGRTLAEAIAAKLGVTLGASDEVDSGPKYAFVDESICIGCARCFKVCPTDAVIGAAKQIHNVMLEACTGCGSCTKECPTGAIGLQPVPVTLRDWNWEKPALAA
jgi:Na+-translocating ferredoxin:NAD+ oxidoreductase subunit B